MNISSSTELITLGTAAGPAIRGKENGMASAVVVDGKHYLVDFGLGCVRAAHQAGLRGQDLVAGFITHLHSDHVGELPAYLMWNWGAPVDGFTTPVGLYGPGKDPNHVRGQQLAGTRELVDHTLKAFSYDLDIRVTDEARPVMNTLLDVQEITLPAAAEGSGNRPFIIYEDDRVTVRAVLVEHPPVFPAFAFRFDTAHGSMTFSGDTAECDALIELARGSDILVHEAVNLEFFTAMGFSPTFINHQRESHTPPEGAGRVAQAAGVKHLVLSHLAGVATPEEWKQRAETSFAGQVTVASSGQRFALNTLAAPVVG
ncbi:MBL fold metallo-hydrolase [Arthrobacter sp. W1]|nr:MBL fold metallo-hydrolase [Arthrobacter sp. W1]